MPDSDSHPIARFFAWVGLLMLTGLFVYQTATGMALTDAAVNTMYLPAPEGTPQWAMGDEPEIGTNAPPVQPAQMPPNAQAAIDFDEP